MNGWAITMIVLLSIGPAISLVKHGEPQGKYSFPASLISALITAFILYKAGLFN